MAGYLLPTQRSYEDTIRFLVHNQFPAIMDKSVKYFRVLPQIGTYRHINSEVVSFKDALLDTTSREFTISGVGSLFDFDKYGHQLKRPTPQLYGTGCEGNSLCLEPTCFGFTEGVIESNNMLQNMCWSLAMMCLKDQLYSERDFPKKMKSYFNMFFQQGPAVLEAYQRTRLLQESIKVVATDRNFTVTGSVIGGSSGISLPFFIDPVDARRFPDLDALTALGAGVGGANLQAFAQFLAGRLFAGNFSEGMRSVKIYGLGMDMQIAKEQTASVVDNFLTRDMIEALRASSIDRIANMLGEFIEDPLFPTFKANTDNVLEPIPYEVLEPSTIAGYVQTSNPEHNLAKYRGLLMVPENWRFNLVEPPQDDFSDLGLGEALNFRMSSPGSFPLMSSSMFSNNEVGADGTVILGQRTGPNGMMVMDAQGLRPRQARIAEAIRTEVLLTYSQLNCNTTTEGQLDNVGRLNEPQGRADGFRLKSTMYVGSDVRGTARPVLLLFQTDNPRSAQPIIVCSSITQTIEDATTGLAITDCCPGGQNYAVLTFNRTVLPGDFAVNDLAIYRTGARGNTFLVRVTAVAGSIVTVTSVTAANVLAPLVLLPCCTGSPDDYGTRAELTKTTGATLLTSEVMKATYDEPSDSLFLEVFEPLAAALINAEGTLTLENGDAIRFTLVAAKPVGVFLQIEANAAETELCDFSTIDCACLVNAVVTLD